MDIIACRNRKPSTQLRPHRYFNQLVEFRTARCIEFINLSEQLQLTPFMRVRVRCVTVIAFAPLRDSYHPGPFVPVLLPRSRQEIDYELSQFSTFQFPVDLLEVKRTTQILTGKCRTSPPLTGGYYSTFEPSCTFQRSSGYTALVLEMSPRRQSPRSCRPLNCFAQRTSQCYPWRSSSLFPRTLFTLLLSLTGKPSVTQDSSPA